jgi:hypothetical protein
MHLYQLQKSQAYTQAYISTVPAHKLMYPQLVRLQRANISQPSPLSGRPGLALPKFSCRFTNGLAQAEEQLRFNA